MTHTYNDINYKFLTPSLKCIVDLTITYRNVYRNGVAPLSTNYRQEVFDSLSHGDYL